MNEKLVKQIKLLSSQLESSMKKPKEVAKEAAAEDKAKEKEIEVAQKKVKCLQKEIAELRAKLEVKTGYERIVELENQIKEIDIKHAECLKELKGLESIEKMQDKELEKYAQLRKPSDKFKELNDQLKEAKERNKELEKKIQADAANNYKQHVNLVDLQEKLHKLKEEKLLMRKAEASPAHDARKEHIKLPEEETLKKSITSLKKRIEFERSVSRKQIEAMKEELEQLRAQVKEREQEKKLRAERLKESKLLVRHNQLEPLNLSNKVKEIAQPVSIVEAPAEKEVRGNQLEPLKKEEVVSKKPKKEMAEVNCQTDDPY
eukprot:TRINITY_DN12181_c0_g2_i1.p1 TRINITY_DN12181_c0_g2~~TRINITY_DN12181_c0_g2_i1.p1  ORF type:complete len:318 (-),score=150.14 TRINITY_DN12181_c0_g2_i1:102-1055(-)